MAFKKLITHIALSSLLAVSSIGHADTQTFKPQAFESQFDENPILLNEQTQWLVFTKTKDGGDWVKNAFDQLYWDAKQLKSQNMIYTVDIHKMPKLVSEFFALPKMRGYKFAVGLDRTGELTRHWPIEENTIAVYELNQLKISKTLFFKEEASFKKFLSNFKTK